MASGSRKLREIMRQEGLPRLAQIRIFDAGTRTADASNRLYNMFDLGHHVLTEDLGFGATIFSLSGGRG
jgi:hypothetical protein